MEKRVLRKLFVLLSAGVVLTACAPAATEDQDQSADVETVEDAETDEDGADAGAEEAEVTANIEILIDGEAVADLSKEVVVPEGTYLMDVMKEQYDVVDEGGFLSAIEGHEQDVDAQRYWLFYSNDEMPSVGAAEYELEEGDVIEWRLEDSDF